MIKQSTYVKWGVAPYCPYCHDDLSKDALGASRKKGTLCIAFANHIVACKKTPVANMLWFYLPDDLKSDKVGGLPAIQKYYALIRAAQHGWGAIITTAEEKGIVLKLPEDKSQLPPIPPQTWSAHWMDWKHLYAEMPLEHWNPLAMVKADLLEPDAASVPSLLTGTVTETAATPTPANIPPDVTSTTTANPTAVTTAAPVTVKVTLPVATDTVEAVFVEGYGYMPMPELVEKLQATEVVVKDNKYVLATPPDDDEEKDDVDDEDIGAKSAQKFKSPAKTLSHVSQVPVSPLIQMLSANSVAGAIEIINSMKVVPIQETILKAYENGAMSIEGDPDIGTVNEAISTLTHTQLRNLLKTAVTKGAVNIPGIGTPDDGMFAPKYPPQAKANAAGAQSVPSSFSSGIGNFAQEVMDLQKQIMLQRMQMEMVKQMFQGEPVNPYKGGAYDKNMAENQQNAQVHLAIKEAIEEATAPLKAQLAIYEKQSEAQKLQDAVKSLVAPLENKLTTLTQAAAQPVVQQSNGNAELLMAINNLGQNLQGVKADFAMAVKDAAMAKSGDFNVNSWMSMFQNHQLQLRQMEKEADKLRQDMVNNILKEKESKIDAILEAKGGGLDDLEKTLAVLEKVGVNPKDLLKSKLKAEEADSGGMMDMVKSLAPVVGQVLAARQGQAPPQQYQSMPPPAAAANQAGAPPGAEVVTLVPEPCFACGEVWKFPQGAKDPVTCPHCISVYMPDGNIKLSQWAAEIRKLAALADPYKATPPGTVEKLVQSGKLQASTSTPAQPLHKHNHAPAPQKKQPGIIWGDEDGAPVTPAPPVPTEGVGAVDVPEVQDAEVD